jgi:hypothetical protein
MCVVLTAVVVAVPRDAEAAAQREWVGLPNGNWSNAANWNGGTQIANGDFLTFGDGSSGGRATNDLVGGNFQRITLQHSLANGYVLDGNGIVLAEFTADEDAGIHEIALNIAGEARTLIADGAFITLSGTNTFTGDVDIAGELTVTSNAALGADTGMTNILPGGELQFAGRDLGNELIRVSPHDAGDCAITNGPGDSVLRNIQVGKSNCINNAGTLNFPNGIQPFAGEFDLLLFGGTYLVGGTSAATGPLRLTGETSLAWNSNAAVDIDFEPFEELQPGGTITGAGTAKSLDFRHGFFKPGNGAASGRFILTGGLSLEDVTLNTVLNGSTTGTGYSQVQAGGTISLGPNTNLDVTLGFTPTAGQSFRIIDNTGAGAVVGTFAGLPEGSTFSRGGRTFTISYKAGTGNDVEITLTNAAPTDPRPFKLRLPMVAKG